jgi:uncharacterized protein YuzE
MNIAYDVKADALYLTLIPGEHELSTTNIDEDIALDFDQFERLVGVEILGASKRTDLRYLLPAEVAGVRDGIASYEVGSAPDLDQGSWDTLRRELVRRKKARIPVRTLKKHAINWVDEVEQDHVVVRRDRSGNRCTISRFEFQEGTEELLLKGFKWSITLALRDIASGSGGN